MNSQAIPEWSALITDSPDWRFDRQVLIHKHFQTETTDSLGKSSYLQKLLVENFWVAQKRSRAVKTSLEKFLSNVGQDQWVLNFGAGHTRVHDRVINVDLFQGDNIDIVVGTLLPLRDSSIDFVVSQEVVEHVDKPDEYIQEAFRVLKPGGEMYCQVPFIIGYHPGPTDFWRFTKEGLVQLFKEQEWDIREIKPTLGHGSGMYRILVEFMAVNASILSSRLYKPVKGLCTVGFYPLQWLDNRRS